MMIHTASRFLLAATVIGMTNGAFAQPASPPPASTPDRNAVSTQDDGYVLGAGDVVEVSVLGREEFRQRVQVQVDGTISLPFLNSVKAADRTVLQLREDVRNALKNGGYYSDPIVSVAIATYASRYVVVLGEVVNPGIVPVDRPYRVSEILARTGGPRASGADEISIRRASGEEIILNVKNISTGGPDEDPFLAPGDKLYIPEAPTYYIYGQVSSPGNYRVDKEMSLRKALARGGGLTSMGSEKRVKVFRDGQEIRKFDPSSPIKGGDVIVVGERFF